MNPPTNFIDDIVTAIQLKIANVDIDLSFTSAHSCVGAVTGDRIEVSTHLGELSPDIMCMVVGDSGCNKTLTHEVAENMIDEIGVLIPADFTTESLPFYFDKKKYKTIKGKDGEKKKVEDGYFYKNYGLITWDEASGQFAEAKNKQYKTGTIELLSSVYNHKLKRAFRKEEFRNIVNPQKPYISLLGNMVPGYFPQIPNLFFSQGIAGRMHWCSHKIEKPDMDNQADWNVTTNYEQYRENIKGITSKLKKLETTLHNKTSPIVVNIDDDANKLIKKFDYETGTIWFTSIKENPFGWDFQYYKRLPEMACKSALRYAIGDNVDDITKLTHINKNQMKRGIAFAKSSSKALNNLFVLKIGFSSNRTPEQRAIKAITDAKNQTLNSGQWQRASGITSPNEFQTLKNKIINQGYIIEVDKKLISDPDERQRLGVNTSAKVFRKVQ